MEDKRKHKENLGENKTIPVIEEKLNVGKRTIETGRFHISKKVFEEEASEDVSVVEENINVERREINQYVDSPPPAVREDGDTTIISVLKEVLVVEKKIMLVEELHITKHKTENSVPVKETLRKEEVKITKSEDGTGFEQS